MSAAKSALIRQKLARQRMLAARGLSSPETTKKETQAMAPPLEMRVNLLPRIAEYHAKGWINDEEESDYHQLLSNGPSEFGGSTDQVALQVQKSLDLAKAKHESSKRTSSAPTNSRSLFRKQTASTIGVGSTEMTLQKKLSYRRKSRMGHQASPQPAVDDADTRDDASNRRDATESKELAIVEAMFGNSKKKNDDKTKENNDETQSPSDKRNERLARARSRRRTSFSPDAINNKSKKEVLTVQQDQTSTGAQNDKDERSQKPSVSVEAAKRLLQSTGSSRRSIFNKSPRDSQQEAPVISLSQSSSMAEPESFDTGKEPELISTDGLRLSSPSTEAAKRFLQKTASKRSIYFQSTKTLNQDSIGKAPTISLSQSTSMVEQENADPGIKKINGESRGDDSRRQVLKTEAPTMFRKMPNTIKTSKGLVICEPRELWWEKNRLQSEDALKDLFVEMAFFARLGFVQPPSCLHCVYRESIENMTPDLGCKQFVPWRKDANTPIHPHQLDDNIMLVQCHAARSLIQGESVDRYRWDKIKRKLICPQ